MSDIDLRKSTNYIGKFYIYKKNKPSRYFVGQNGTSNHIVFKKSDYPSASQLKAAIHDYVLENS